MKFGSFRGNHSLIGKVIKLLGRLYLKALEHAMKHGKKAKLYRPEAKLAWQSLTIDWFAALRGVDDSITDWVVHEGPCEGLRSSSLVRAYKKFAGVRRLKALDRRHWDDQLWEAWVGRRMLREKDDDERWGRRDGDPPAPRAELIDPATVADHVSISSDDDDDSSSSGLSDFEKHWPSHDGWESRWKTSPAAASSTHWETWGTWRRQPADSTVVPAWGPAAKEQQRGTPVPVSTGVPIIIVASKAKNKRGDGGCGDMIKLLDEEPCFAVTFPCPQWLDDEINLPACWQPRAEGGAFPWDRVAGKSEPHIRRSEGPAPCRGVRGNRPGDIDVVLRDGFRLGSWSYTRARAQRDLMAWMAMRPGFTDNFESMAEVDVSGVCECFRLKGSCLYMRKRGAKDVFREDPPPGCTWGAHATSPYCIRRIVANDTLAVGMASLSIKSKAVFGVFFHLLARMDVCQAIHAHYVSFTSEGWFWAPFVLLVSDLEMYAADGSRLKSVARRCGGFDQRLTYPGHHSIVGLLWHMVHVADIMTSPAYTALTCEASWLDVLELSPNDSWETIQAKSEAWKDDAMWLECVD